jgi:probable HAF family extracellular repeat protein
VDSVEMLDLGTFGGTLSEATLINNAGQVAGYGADADGYSHAFLFTDANGNGQVDAGEVADFGTFGGISSTPTSLNEAGQLAGFYDTADDAQRAFLYTDENSNGLVDAGEVDELGTLGGSYSLATDLTEDGRVIGFSSNADDTALFAYIYTDANSNGVVDSGEMQNLNLLIPGDSGWVLDQPMMINEAGDIVGTGYKDGVLSPFLMTEQESTPEEPATIQDVEGLVSGLVSEGRLGSIAGVVLLTKLRIARSQLEAGRESVALAVLHATELTINALHNSRRLSDEDYELLIGLLNEVIENLA